MDIEWIRQKVKVGSYRLSSHAEEERQQDEISIYDMESALLGGEIIENYPNDPRGQSCLVLGFCEAGLPLHLVVGRTTGQNLLIITVYIPSEPKWINPKQRRP